jgi:hypothetical protein
LLPVGGASVGTLPPAAGVMLERGCCDALWADELRGGGSEDVRSNVWYSRSPDDGAEGDIVHDVGFIVHGLRIAVPV